MFHTKLLIIPLASRCIQGILHRTDGPVVQDMYIHYPYLYVLSQHIMVAAKKNSCVMEIYKMLL